MEFDPFQKSPFLFLLFLINKHAATLIRKYKSLIRIFLASLKEFTYDGHYLIPEHCVASAVFAFTFIAFSVFVVRVIGQITSYLDINCLTIKKKVQ